MSRSLTSYRKKRDFKRTPEPRGAQASGQPGEAPLFVVQKHDARTLHYDFRLELDGVLHSWAVPKGPSLDPSVKRLAVQTEDHPVEYGSFEGTIPEGEYGGGAVMLWDRGTWEPERDPEQQYREGRLSFTLHGQRLKGKWHLVRTSAKKRDQRGWLLFKANDAEAARGADALVEDHSTSVASGRSMQEIRAESTGVTLSNPEKILYPEQGISKIELAEHYVRVSELMLPHVVDRPLMLLRCPEGRRKSCFYYKHPRENEPAALRRVSITEKKGPATYAVIDDLEGLLSLVQLGALEVHTWGSRAKDLERPDLMVLDLDPDAGVKWESVVECALLLRGLFAELELESFVKTTGGKGLHVCVPLLPSAGWDEVKRFCRAVAASVARLAPDLYVDTAAKDKRRHKIFVDYLRNTRGATFVAPYSTRATAGAPIALPIDWSELEEVGPDSVTLRSLPERLSSHPEDPWSALPEVEQRLTASRLASVQASASSARKKRSR